MKSSTCHLLHNDQLKIKWKKCSALNRNLEEKDNPKEKWAKNINKQLREICKYPINIWTDVQTQ